MSKRSWRDDANTHVRAEDGDVAVIVGPDGYGGWVDMRLSRGDARILASRIIECLDATS